MTTPPPLLMNIVPTKLRYFHDKGLAIRGVIHVGMSWGEEIADYLAMGATHVIGFEPTPDAFAEAQKLYGSDPRVLLRNFALGSKSEDRFMTVIDDKEPMVGHPVGTGGSTFLKELSIPEGTPERITRSTKMVPVHRFDELPVDDIENYNALVIDVQGMELEVLKGFGDLLKHFDCMNIECSRIPVYEGEAPAQEVIDYLAGFGLKQMTPIEDHNDILFRR